MVDETQITTVTTSVPTPTPTDTTSWVSPRFLSTKFIIVLILALAGCVGLFLKLVDAEHFNWFTGIILTGHGTANVIDKKLNNTQQP